MKHPRLASGAMNAPGDHRVWEVSRPSHFLLWIPREKQLPAPPGRMVRGEGRPGGPRPDPSEPGYPLPTTPPSIGGDRGHDPGPSGYEIPGITAKNTITAQAQLQYWA